MNPDYNTLLRFYRAATGGYQQGYQNIPPAAPQPQQNVLPPQTVIQVNSTTINKGCAEVLASADTVELNSKGVYLVGFDSSLATATTVQLFKDGVAQPQAQSTGTTPNFTTFVQVGRNNCGCCCSSPVRIQIKNVGSASSDFTDAHIVVVKLPCDRG